MNTFALVRRMGTSVQMIDATYGHLISDSIEREAALLDDFDNSVLPNLSLQDENEEPDEHPNP